MKKYFGFIFLLFIVFFGCDSTSVLEPEIDQVVVQAFLYANEPVTDIKLTRTLALGSEDSLAPPINDAVVYLDRNGTRYDSIASAGDSGYYHYPGTDLVVENGDVFQIVVSYFGKLASGTTEVPSSPTNVSISSTTLPIPTEMTFPPDPNKINASVTVSWDSIPGALFYVTVDNIEVNPQEIDTFGGGFRPPGGGMKGGPQRFISAPGSSNEYQVNRFMVTHYGNHLVRVYRVNQEYADLYISRQQDSRDLNEPLSNIQNGLGVFSAFNSNSVTFTARAE
jgi:hypothetical protein